MHEKQQRELAAELFPFLDTTGCWPDILPRVKEHREKILDIIKDREIPSEWAYEWAYEIGDREIMRDSITESAWAYFWARDIGDSEIMRERITEPYWKSKLG